MIVVSSEFLAALTAVSNEPVDLYELMLDGGTLRFSDQAINWNGQAYVAKVRERSTVKRYQNGQFDGVTVQFWNVDTSAAATFLTQNIEGRRIIVRKVLRGVDNDSLVIFHGLMRRVSRIDENTVQVEAEELLASIDQDIPGRLFTAGCGWNFKGPRCGYVGAETVCDRSWARCNALGRTHRYGGFRFVPHTGTYQYQETETKRFLLLFRRKKTVNLSANFASVDDTPYDVPIPIILGRAQIAGVPIQHADEGGVTKVLAAIAAGPIENMFFPRANEQNSPDWNWHSGNDGAPGDHDPRFPLSYAYSRLAYVGVTIPSDVRTVDAAPTITVVVQGMIPDRFNAGGAYDGFGWTDNPIWNVRHLLTLPLEEGGGGVPGEWFDDARNYVEAAYCAGAIVDATNGSKIYYPTDLPAGTAYRAYKPTGVIGSDPAADGPYAVYGVADDDTSLLPVTYNIRRFTLNAAIAKQGKLSDILLKKLFPAYRGYHTYSKEGKIQLRVERPVPNSTIVSAVAAGANTCAVNLPWPAVGDLLLFSPFTATAEVRRVTSSVTGTIGFAALTYAHAAGDAVYTIAQSFDDRNMIGTAAYPLEERQASVNRVNVKYINSAAGFAEAVVQVNDYEHQAQTRRVNAADVDGSAIDNFCQAYRIGQFIRTKMRELGKFVELRSSIAASLLEIGDVIAVTAVECGLQAAPFQVIELGFEANDEVTIVGQLYDVRAYDDTAPQATVSVPAMFGGTEIGGGPGVLVPNDVTDVVGDWEWGARAADGSRPAVLTVTYTAPVAGDFAGVRASYQVGSGAIIPAGQFDAGIPVTIEILAPNPEDDVTVWLASRTERYEKPQDGTTPHVVIPDVGGSLDAENVASVTGTASYDSDNWGLFGTVTFGAHRDTIRYCELRIMGPYSAAGAVLPGATIDKPFATFIPPLIGNYDYSVLPTWPRGGADVKFEVAVRVFNDNNVDTPSPTKSAKFAVTAVNQTTQATSCTITVIYENPSADGLGEWRVQWTYIPPNDVDFGTLKVYAERQTNPGSSPAIFAERILHTATGGDGVGGGYLHTGTGDVIGPVPKVPTQWRFSFVTITRDGQERPGAPTATVTVTSLPGKLSAARIDQATLSPEFTLDPGGFQKLTPGSIGAEKLFANWIDIGGGGSKPARLRAFDPFGAIFAYIGLDPFGLGENGAWFKMIGLGGTDPRFPKLRCTSLGELSITGGTFELNLNGITTTINNIFASTGYAGLRIRNNSTGAELRAMAGYLGLLAPSSAVTVVSIDTNVGYGTVSVRDSFGTERAYMSGQLGTVGCKYLVAGDPSSPYSIALLGQTATTANSGSAGALPAQPLGYFIIQTALGLLVKMPFYNY